MTIKQLVAALAKYPDDAEVMLQERDPRNMFGTHTVAVAGYEYGDKKVVLVS